MTSKLSPSEKLVLSVSLASVFPLYFLFNLHFTAPNLPVCSTLLPEMMQSVSDPLLEWVYEVDHTLDAFNIILISPMNSTQTRKLLTDRLLACLLADGCKHIHTIPLAKYTPASKRALLLAGMQNKVKYFGV